MTNGQICTLEKYVVKSNLWLNLYGTFDICKSYNTYKKLAADMHRCPSFWI